MKAMKWHVNIIRQPYGIGFDMRVGAWSEDGKFLCVIEQMPVRQYTRESREAHDAPEIPPSLSIHGEDGPALFQALMDALWQEGYRPKDIGTAGHLAATQEHLEDMRKIAFTMLSHPQARTVPQ